MSNEHFSGNYNIKYNFGIVLLAMKNISSSWRKTIMEFQPCVLGYKNDEEMSQTPREEKKKLTVKTSKRSAMKWSR